MARMALMTIGILMGAYLLLPTGHAPAADEKPVPAAGAEFANKFVAVNFKTAGTYHSQLLQHATVRRLGGREFLVGEVCVKDGGPEDWKGALLWVPMESVDTLMVFSDKARAWAAADGFMKADRNK